MSENEREHTLDEWCDQLHEDHGVNRELRALRFRAEHPIRWRSDNLARRLSRRLDDFAARLRALR